MYSDSRTVLKTTPNRIIINLHLDDSLQLFAFPLQFYKFNLVCLNYPYNLSNILLTIFSLVLFFWSLNYLVQFSVPPSILSCPNILFSATGCQILLEFSNNVRDFSIRGFLCRAIDVVMAFSRLLFLSIIPLTISWFRVDHYSCLDVLWW